MRPTLRKKLGLLNSTGQADLQASDGENHRQTNFVSQRHLESSKYRDRQKHHSEVEKRVRNFSRYNEGYGVDTFACDRRIPRFPRRNAAQTESHCTSYVPKAVYYSHNSHCEIEGAVSLENAVIEEE